MNKVPVRAILDTRAPGNIVLPNFVKKLGLQPDLIHEEIYGTADPHSTKSIGAYSSLPIKFGSLITTAPAVVLENQDYNPLIGTSFLKSNQVEIDYDTMSLTILKQTLPINTTRRLKKKKSLTAYVNNNPCNIMYTFKRKHFFPMPKIIK